MNSLKHKMLTSLLVSIFVLTSCATNKVGLKSQSGSQGAYKVGNPYQIMGKWYYPKEDYSYVETGVASWYGEDFHAKYTANGDVYDMNTLTAAHRTLPLPSVVRVTNLENGRSLVVRVNDRGPFAKDRIIDISKRGAQILGFQGQGTTKVKVELLEEESLALKQALLNGTDIKKATPKTYAQSEPRVIGKAPIGEVKAPTSEPKATVLSGYTETTSKKLESGFYVQAGSFSNKEMAYNLKNQLHKYGSINISPVDVNGNRYYRVKVGPFYGKTDANIALLKIKDTGLADAKVIIE